MADPTQSPPSPSHPSPTPDRRFKIGYALAPKKQQSFIRDSLLTLASSRNIDFVKIDPDIPLTSQGPFDCVLHKLYGDDWKQQLSDFHSLHPSSPIVDSPSAIERLHNRISMLQVVSELKKNNPTNPANVKISQNINHAERDHPQQQQQQQPKQTFGIPKQIVIYDSETLTDPRSWEFLKFPVIAKPLVADGSAKSHKMSLVYTPTALTNLKPPIVLQEFVNHGGVIFKVYVVGEFVKCVKRKSLPDVCEEKVESVGGIVTFSQVSNLASNEKTDEKYYKMMQLDECEMPPQTFIADIAKGLREALRLNLFNFDVIRDTRLGNRYLVIDINYFPGYAKMPAYESVMIDFFWNLLANKDDKDKEGDKKDKLEEGNDNGVEE